jgi:hypothetical protein
MTKVIISQPLNGQNTVKLYHRYDEARKTQGLWFEVESDERPEADEVLIWGLSPDQADKIATLFEQEGWVSRYYERESAAAKKEEDNGG